MQQDETNKQCPNTHSFISIEEPFPTKSVKVIPATVGAAGITGLPYFIPLHSFSYIPVFAGKPASPSKFIYLIRHLLFFLQGDDATEESQRD